MSRIAIDLVPLRPGGENGGAKLVALELLQGFKKHASDDEFLLLTAPWNRDELEPLAQENLSCLDYNTPSPPPKRIRTWLQRAGRRLPRDLKKLIHTLLYRKSSVDNYFLRGPLKQAGVDLLFCPFTAIDRAEPGIPTVSLLHDLQHRDLPHLFSESEKEHRDVFLDTVRRNADAIICVSQHVRERVLQHLKSDPDRTFAVPNCIHLRLPRIDPDSAAAIRRQLGFGQRPYLFYPANFWPHKNHRMLLLALSRYRVENPDDPLELVLTGALKNARHNHREDTVKLGLEKVVHFPGYLDEAALAAVWEGCEALIFPSLYEGFGIPLLEAMTFGKPILCSRLTSLPEVAGEAAIYFDPRKPREIVNAISKLRTTQNIDTLIARGMERLALFTPDKMVQGYLQIIHGVLKNPRMRPLQVQGIYSDHWTEPAMRLAAAGPARLLLTIEAPSRQYQLQLSLTGSHSATWKIPSGELRQLDIPVTPGMNYFELKVSPTFKPGGEGPIRDDRELGVRCLELELQRENGEVEQWLP